MGEFDLSMPRPVSRYSLGNFQLRLDPQIKAAIQALRTQPPSPVLRSLFVRPNWAALDARELQRLLSQPPAIRRAFAPRGKGPTTVRPAEVIDLLTAIWGIPAVGQTGELLLNNASQHLRRDWGRLSGGQRALVVSQGVVLIGGGLTAVLSEKENRAFVMNLIADQDIPVPGLSGLTVKINPRGGGATYRNIGGSGVTVSGGGGVDKSGQAQYNIKVSLDVVRFIDVLK